MIETRTCTKCNRVLPGSSFYKDKAGKHTWCKECFSEYNKSRYVPKDVVPEVQYCTHCGDIIHSKMRRILKFCSTDCKNAARTLAQKEAGRRAVEELQLECARCGEPIPITGYATRRKYCSPECTSKAGNSRRTPEERAAYSFKRRYGITLERRAEMLESQGGCAICMTGYPGPKGWVLDHDHSCCSGESSKTCGKCIRGVLCGRCNLGIGLLNDSAQTLDAAAAYLRSSVRDKGTFQPT